MEYTEIKGYRISKLILGTVALGINYGINNINGLPAMQQRYDVLSTAFDGGINTLDTARGYGAAEQTIGDFIGNKNLQHSVNIITKFKLSEQSLSSYRKAKEGVLVSIHDSLKELRISKLPICLLHMSRKLNKELVLQYLPRIFKELIEDQLIDVAGISIDHPLELEWFKEEPVIEAFQVPINIFDHRLLGNDTLQRLHENGKMIFARSIFLQGLLFLNPDQLKGNLVVAKPYLEQLRLLADQEGISVAELAFSYILHMKCITSIVLGAENVNQVKQNIQLLNKPSLPKSVIAKIKEVFSNVPEDVVTPGNWVL